MMARKTRKYLSALATVRSKKVKLGNRDHESVYEALNNANFFWDHKSGEWEHKQHAPSTSVFQADDGSPTGIVKIRVMAHPDDLESAIVSLKKCLGLKVIEISEKTYPNRKGTGERIYTTAILDGAK